jgi:CotH kinase protein/Lamin Tail Domain/Chitobiase/beta-hexosaminidase C-terminal domain/Legume lectin domain
MKTLPVILGLAVILIAREASADPTLVISEFMANNTMTLTDEDGAYSDWIELFNSSTNTVDLGGWYLANKATNLTQWMFPSTNLGPNEFIVVFASNKNRRVAGAPLHTNFKLGSSGEYLALVQPDGVTKASEFAPAFPQQYADISYGYLMNGPDLLPGPPTYLDPPTPGIWNNSSAAPVLPPSVTFYPPPGVYKSNTLPVTLTASSSSAIIYYTLDGSTPGVGSPIYTRPLPLTTNAAIRAVGILQGVIGPVGAANYILLDSSLANFSSNLPLLIVDTLGQAIPSDHSKIAAYALTIDTNSSSGRAAWTNSIGYAGRLGFGIHGQSSAGFPKQPFKLETDDESETAVDYPLLGLPIGNDWMLDPFYDDKTLMNDYLSYELFESMGRYSVRRRYFELFLHESSGKLTSGEYWGVYALIEKIRVAANRVNIANLTIADNTPPSVTGGYIIAKDKLNAPTDPTFTTSSGEVMQMYRPTFAEITQPQLDYITGYINAFEAALYGPNWRDPLTGYAAYIDVDSFVDFHWIVEYCKNIDGFRLSNYLSKDRGGKLVEGPIWDWDLSWGNANYLQGGNTNYWYYPQISDNDDLWLRKLRTDPDFYQKIIDRWGALRLNVLNATNLLARVDQITNLLWEAQARDFARWPRLGTYVWPNPNGAAGGWDVDYVTPTTYSGIIFQLKKFVLGRYLWIDQQFVPAPALVTNGATLSLSAPLGSIYYTLDNSDPRASGGGLSASARRYSGAVALTNNAGIFTRAFCTNAWSPPTRALYIAALPDLRITEINYHPAPPPTNSPYQEKDFEFIEIQNTGSNVINLAGARIGGGIDFTFAPNEFVTVGTATSNNFDGGGTPFFASTLGATPGPYLTNDGPAGTLLCLLNSRTNTTRNRITFNQTAVGNYDRLTADFDFRATTTAAAVPGGAPTLADFDSAGTAYTLTHSGPTAPVVLAADTDSTGNYLRLVPASGGELGVIAFNQTAAGAFNSVVATFDFRITPPAGGTPADGLGFALLSTAAYGTSGAGPFFGEEPGLTSSIGVGFDVYNNGPTPQEPNNNHVSLHWNSAQIGNAATPSFSLSSGKFHRAQVLVQFSGGNAYVTVRLTPDINGTPGPTETVFQNAMLPSAAAYASRVVFGARTGGAWAAHDLDNVNVQYSANAAAAAGLSMLILPASQFGTNGPGTTLAAFTDLPLVTNTLALDFAFSPSNLFNDASLFWNRSSVVDVGLNPSTLVLDAGVFHHARLQLDALNGGAYATLTLTPDSLGTPGTPLNVLTNWFVPGVVLGNNRLELAARNGGLLSKVDLDNLLADFQSLAPLLLNPGESIVVVHNLAAFISRYGAGIRVAGEFSGSLDNAGEHLTLTGPLGEPILDFSYDPAWYPATDGGGFSLVAVNPNAPPSAWGLAQNWRPSSRLGGSPGAIDPASPPAVLTAAQGPGNVLRLAWPAGSGSFALYSSAALDAPTQWSSVTNAPALLGDQWVVDSIPPINRATFYRLQAQVPGGP